jgi:putative ABC transport system permease protein
MALSAAVGFVLLIACVNVADLLLARRQDIGSVSWRSDGRSAPRGSRLVRQLLAENLVVAILGGVCGLRSHWWVSTCWTWLRPVMLPRAIRDRHRRRL